MNADPICVHLRGFADNELGYMSQQLALNYRNLSINHSTEIELTTASEGKVLGRVRKCLRVPGILERRHQNQQRG